MTTLRILYRHAAESAQLIALLSIAVAVATLSLRLHGALREWPSAAGVDDLVALRDRDGVAGAAGAALAPAHIVESLAERRASGIRQVAAYSIGRQVIDRGDLTFAVDVANVTPEFFAILDAKPLAGRLLNETDRGTAPGGVAVISQRLRTALEANGPGLGTMIGVGGRRYEIIGVLPSTMWFPVDTVDVWLPIRRPQPGRVTYVSAIARLSPGATAKQVEDELRAMADALVQRADRQAQWHPLVTSVASDITRKAEQPLALLLAAALTMFCMANWTAAGQLYQRGVARRLEFSTRLALGAMPLRILLDLSKPYASLALAAGVLGTLLAWLSFSVVQVLLPALYPKVLIPEFGSQGLSLAISATAIVVVWLSIVPVWAIAPELRIDAFRSGGGIGAGKRESLLRNVIFVQSMLAATLLAYALMLAVDFWKLTRVDPGYNAHDVLVADVRLPGGAEYGPRLSRAVADLRRAVSAMPNVLAVGVGNMLPFGESSYESSFALPPRLAVTDTPARAAEYWITVGYVEALGITVLEGRAFTVEDEAKATTAAMVNTEFVRRYMHANDVLGAVIDSGLGSFGGTVEIVGIVKPVLKDGLDQEPRAEIYLLAKDGADAFRRDASLIVRTDSLSPDDLRGVSIGSAGVVVDRPRRLASSLRDSVWIPQLAAMVAGAFGMVATALAALSVFTIVTYRTYAMRKDIAVRLAFGANWSTIRRDITRRTLVPVSLGSLAGGPIVAVVEWLSGRSQATEMTSTVAPILASIVCLIVTASAAAWRSGRSVSTISPAEVLRS